MAIKKLSKKEEEKLRKERRFPILGTVIMIVLIIVQCFSLMAAFFYEAKPQDVINEYKIYVTPNENGSLDIEYKFVWTPLDEKEPLTWVEIGMPNGNFDFKAGYSDNVKKLENKSSDGYAYANVFFKKEYLGGDKFSFSFKVTQYSMLTEQYGKKVYELVPGWFNSTEVEKYEFYWKKSDNVTRANSDYETSDWYVWKGSLKYGEYRRLRVNYEGLTAAAIPYENDVVIDAYDGISGDTRVMRLSMWIVIVFCALGELIIVDSYVSYAFGRGFLRGYGYHMHVYGRRNPHYIAAQRVHSSNSRGGSRGGGCACACACACAGGGRAGCSQKDTYKNEK